jgi:hypothetical protein
MLILFPTNIARLSAQTGGWHDYSGEAVGELSTIEVGMRIPHNVNLASNQAPPISHFWNGCGFICAQFGHKTDNIPARLCYLQQTDCIYKEHP